MNQNKPKLRTLTTPETAIERVRQAARRRANNAWYARQERERELDLLIAEAVARDNR